MGEVISKQASVEDIFADIATVLERAAARKGVWQTEAERFLRQSALLGEEVGLELKTVAARVATLVSQLDAMDDEADAVLARIYDEIYNLLDRPGAGSDPVWELMFPGGSSAYTAARLAEQPTLMLMLARLLERNVHSAIPSAKAAAYAVEIRTAANKLRDAVLAHAGPAAELRMLETMRGTVSRSGQVQLARLKRTLKGLGKSEADVHQVIPDRPRSRKPKAGGADDVAPTEEVTTTESAAPPEPDV